MIEGHDLSVTGASVDADPVRDVTEPSD